MRDNEFEMDYILPRWTARESIDRLESEVPLWRADTIDIALIQICQSIEEVSAATNGERQDLTGISLPGGHDQRKYDAEWKENRGKSGGN